MDPISNQPNLPPVGKPATAAVSAGTAAALHKAMGADRYEGHAPQRTVEAPAPTSFKRQAFLAVGALGLAGGLGLVGLAAFGLIAVGPAAAGLLTAGIAARLLALGLREAP